MGEQKNRAQTFEVRVSRDKRNTESALKVIIYSR
jgi:hypothetical protein